MSFTAAVVITFKAPEKLAACLASLEGQCRTYVVDNSPPAENLLYTAGINHGISILLWAEDRIYPQPDYILICCDDVTVGDGAVAALSKYLDENPECGIAMPLQVSRDGKVNCGGCTVAFPFGRHVCEPLGHSLYEKPYESYWANGACFLARAEMIREIGLLDENMKFVCSDSDYSFTARSRGWKIFVVPDARVIHEADGALHYKNPFIERTKDEDHIYFMKKWIIGGLFRELSAEGPTLTADVINQRYQQLTWLLAQDYTKLGHSDKT